MEDKIEVSSITVATFQFYWQCGVQGLWGPIFSGIWHCAEFSQNFFEGIKKCEDLGGVSKFGIRVSLC